MGAAPPLIYPRPFAPCDNPAALSEGGAAMDGSAAIEQNRLALKRITLSLMAMAGLDTRPDAEGRTEGPHRPTLPRHLWLAILRLLRPAEAAAQACAEASARGPAP